MANFFSFFIVSPLSKPCLIFVYSFCKPYPLRTAHRFSGTMKPSAPTPHIPPPYPLIFSYLYYSLCPFPAVLNYSKKGVQN